MGAEQFITKSRGKTAQEAFDAAVEKAQFDYGHAGYTGTIAEKSEFKMVYRLVGESSEAAIDRCMGADEHFCQDKWGAAACVEGGPDPKDLSVNVYHFFGCASS